MKSLVMITYDHYNVSISIKELEIPQLYSNLITSTGLFLQMFTLIQDLLSLGANIAHWNVEEHWHTSMG